MVALATGVYVCVGAPVRVCLCVRARARNTTLVYVYTRARKLLCESAIVPEREREDKECVAWHRACVHVNAKCVYVCVHARAQCVGRELAPEKD